MATVLVIEDRPLDRERLATILRSDHHDVVEAADGQEALRTLPQIRPDLIISDILMPTMDGSELVRRMRQTAAFAATPVIFCTAAFHESEARALAIQCGVVATLTRPSTRDVIIATVNAALGAEPPDPAGPVGPSVSGRQHLHVVSSTFAARIGRFETEKLRMATLDDVARGITSERDPISMFNKLCRAARELTFAQHAVVGLLAEDGSVVDAVYTFGVDVETKRTMTAPAIGSSVIGDVVRRVEAVRARNPTGRPEDVGLPADNPPVSSFLSVSVASPRRVYGWLSLRNKLGADEFTAADEKAAIMLGTHAGIAYDHTRHFAHLHHRIGELEHELDRKSAIRRRIQDEERKRIAGTIHDELAQTLAAMNMDLHRLRKELAATPGAADRGRIERVDSLLTHVDESVQFVRRLSTQLRPRGVAKTER